MWAWGICINESGSKAPLVLSATGGVLGGGGIPTKFTVDSLTILTEASKMASHWPEAEGPAVTLVACSNGSLDDSGTAVTS